MDDECPICALAMILPTSISGCGHTFCFMCIKGVSLTGNAHCPMCRQSFSSSQFKHPKAVDVSLDMGDPEAAHKQSASQTNAVAVGAAKVKKEVKDEVDDGTYGDRTNINNQTANAQKQKTVPFWLYGGRSGSWWRYDPRTETVIEDAFSKKMSKAEVVTIGKTYVVNLDRMTQYRRDNPGVERSILRVEGKEELLKLNVRGIAGVPVNKTH